MILRYSLRCYVSLFLRLMVLRLSAASLVSLLGLLGDVMAQVDGLKVLRALLRYREDMLDGMSPSWVLC